MAMEIGIRDDGKAYNEPICTYLAPSMRKMRKR